MSLDFKAAPSRGAPRQYVPSAEDYKIMAPSATEPIALHVQKIEVKLTEGVGPYKELASIGYEKETEEEGKSGFRAAKYQNYLPYWGNEKFPPLEKFQHFDRGLDAVSSFPELLGNGVTTVELTPSIGTEVSGIQISKLSSAGKNELARFVAERKAVAFRDQDFADLPIDQALEFGRYFGRLHIHPTSGAPEGYPEVHLVHRGAGDRTADVFFANRTSSVAWHSDVSYEVQPPGTTLLYILDIPETGGDTLFANQVEAYNRLSEGFKERLHGLRATHSGIEQIDASKLKGGAVRREPVTSEHPIVRTHPVTGEKALYVNPQFTRKIVGYKQEESDALLKFLYDHIAYGADFHVRIKWAAKTVVVWDNRVTSHSALVDWKSGQRRHLARITPQAEAPTETPYKQ